MVGNLRIELRVIADLLEKCHLRCGLDDIALGHLSVFE